MSNTIRFCLHHPFLLALGVMIFFTANTLRAADLTPVLFDSHIHYDWDVWQALPPEQAIKSLKNVGIQHALVSATPTEGAELLYKADPELVIPFLRPYKNIRHRYLWFKDAETPAYIREHLQRAPYRGIGEFHVFGKDTKTPVMEDIIMIAREHQLALHAHTDIEGIKFLLERTPEVPVLWAHGGFNAPIELLKSLLAEHENLYIELSLREGMLDEYDQLTTDWKDILIEYKHRFLAGMDTYKPSRWAELPDIAEETRHWLLQLPEDTAAAIAQENMARLFIEKPR